jgi:aspartate/methionine/tyrosine aminotransferase
VSGTLYLIAGSPKSVEVLAKFLKVLETHWSRALEEVTVVTDEEGTLYVCVEFDSDEENLSAGEEMAQVSARIHEESGVLVVLSPATCERNEQEQVATET